MNLKTDLLDLGKGRRWAEGDNIAKQQDAMYAHALVAAMIDVRATLRGSVCSESVTACIEMKADELMAEWLGEVGDG
jgi:hypothetical protein